MRILLAADQYPEFHNGAGASTERLAGGFVRRGHEVTLAYPSVAGSRSSGLRSGVHDERLTSVTLPRGQGVRVCPPMRAAREAAAIVRAGSFDVVHVQSHLPVGRAVLAAARRSGIPVVATNHFMPENLLPHVPAPDVVRRRLGAWAWRDLARVFGGADLVTTPTARAAELLSDRAGLDATVVSNGIDLELHAPRTGDTAGSDDPFVLFVGRLEQEKRVEDLLRAFAAVPADVRSRLVYVGTGSRLPVLRRLATDLGVADRVEFWGNVSDERLRRAYADCAVFSAPGIAELQSLVTLEAIACGAPVVAADAVALPHLVHHGRNGYRYPTDQPQQLTVHLSNLLSSPALRHRMSAASRRIAQTHDITITLDTFLALYERLVEAAGTRTSRPAEPALAA
jgi:phosphatidylinositol alpha 1,6-mannosyltransferase